MDGRRIRVVRENVPCAEFEIVERRQRQELANVRYMTFRPFSEPDRTELCKRADRLCEAFSREQHAGDHRRRDGAEAGKKHAEFARGGCNRIRLAHASWTSK